MYNVKSVPDYTAWYPAVYTVQGAPKTHITKGTGYPRILKLIKVKYEWPAIPTASWSEECKRVLPFISSDLCELQVLRYTLYETGPSISVSLSHKQSYACWKKLFSWCI